MSSLTAYALTTPVQTEFNLPQSVLRHSDLRTAFPYLAQFMKGLDPQADPLSAGMVLELSHAFDYVRELAMSDSPSSQVAVEAMDTYFGDDATWADANAEVDIDLTGDQMGKIRTCQPLVTLLKDRPAVDPDFLSGLILGRLTVLQIAQQVEEREPTLNDPHGDDVIDAPNGTDALMSEIDDILDENPSSMAISHDDIVDFRPAEADFSTLKTTLAALKAIDGTHSVKVWLGDDKLCLSGKLRAPTIVASVLTMVEAAIRHLDPDIQPEFRPAGADEIIFSAQIG